MSIYGYQSALNDFAVIEVFGAFRHLAKDVSPIELNNIAVAVLGKTTYWSMKFCMRTKAKLYKEMTHTDPDLGDLIMKSISYKMKYHEFFRESLIKTTLRQNPNAKIDLTKILELVMTRFKLFHMCCILNH